MSEQPYWKDDGEEYESNARRVTVDFTNVANIRLHASGRLRDDGGITDLRPRTADGTLLTPKQIRARARRRANRKNPKESLTAQEFEALYKPVEEWDLEELSRGRPRASDGSFAGPKPKWITREVHERAMEAFQTAVKGEMGSLTPQAIKTLTWVMMNDDTDDRGKPLVPASAKNQASMFLIEHIVGKPKQHVQQDISVKLQGLLGSVMVNPNEALAPNDQGGQYGQGELPGYSVAHLPGTTIPLGVEEAVVEGEVVEDE